MDTSETYIKMREKAIPDLGMGKPPEGVDEDITTGGDTYLFQTPSIFIDAKGDWYYSTETEAVQLERQDQLQEMVGDNISQTLHDFVWWLDDCYGTGADEFYVADANLPSMEQLWLAFVMFQLHSKIWVNGEWHI